MNHKQNYINGKELEEYVYQQIKTKLQTDKNWTNIIIKRPIFYDGKQYHNKKKIEIDNMFYYNEKLYIIQCKHRKKSNKYLFWLPNRISNKIWFNGKEVTGQYLDNLWKAKEYIRFNPLYQVLGKPSIQTVLLIRGNIKCNKEPLNQTAYLRDTYVLTHKLFNQFLQQLLKMTTPTSQNLHSVIGNKRVYPNI